MTDRGPVVRCVIPGCPFVGYFTPYADRCPEHRQQTTRKPTLTEAWETDERMPD